MQPSLESNVLRGQHSDPPVPHAEQAENIAQRFEVDPSRGLTRLEAANRLVRFGENRLQEVERQKAWRVLAAQFRSLIVALLFVAAVLSFVWGHVLEGVSVLMVLVINAVLGFVTELRAVRSMEALRQMGDVEATVRRDGTPMRVAARELVPGDVLLVEAGDGITADARLFAASRLAADESTLTGESIPVDKDVVLVPPGTTLAERTGMLFKGTSATRGSGEAIVVATGTQTEVGKIAELVEHVENVETPLEKRLDRLGRQLLWVSLGFATALGVSGFLSGRDLFVVVETAIALAVATVPEGLPIVATVALARGMRSMAKRNALVNRLSAVEALGSTSLILTDKTGTLTENRMRVGQLALPGREIDLTRPKLEGQDESIVRPALEIAALCNDASLPDSDTGEGRALGDPMEVALLVASKRVGLSRQALLRNHPEVRQEAFDPRLKMMATVHRWGDSFLYAVKGATESVLPASAAIALENEERPLTDVDRNRWLARSEALAADGHRVLALARRLSSSGEENAYENLTFVGLVGLLDPPRSEVREAIQRFRDAGVRIVMATGDQSGTAVNVAQAVDLVEGTPRVIHGSVLEGDEAWDDETRAKVLHADVVARATPKNKLTLLSEHQRAGQTVAMLGDGVNDAPALHRADIGVAMGQRGTQVAREAADMVLLDDQLGTVAVAIEQGRVIFDNIRKFVVYLLSCNLSEILIIGMASVVQAPLPLLPLQILFLNLVTDVFPALALAAGEGDPDIMRRSPRPRHELILSRSVWKLVFGYGALLTVAVLGVFAVTLGVLEFEEQRAVTTAFLTLGFAQLMHVFNMASPSSGLLVNEITKNPTMWGALGLCTVLLLGATYAPGVSEVLRIQDPGALGWALIGGASLAPPILVLAVRLSRRLASGSGLGPTARRHDT